MKSNAIPSVHQVSTSPSIENNFDLLRLLAALQVVFCHAYEHLNIDHPFLNFIYNNVLKYFPGVPIFFCISGFLIFWSFDRNQSKILVFFRNRFLRLYPALWMCLIFTAVLLLICFPLVKSDLLSSFDFYKWLLAQASFFQFYTPDLLRFWGVGTPNGSLWTIAVELQFYFFVPLLFLVLQRAASKWKIILFLFMVLSISANIAVGFLVKESMLHKLSNVFILPYLYYFLIGVVLYKKWTFFANYFEGKFFLWIIVYVLYFVIFGNFLNFNISSYWISNPFKIISDFLLIFCVVSFAFSKKNLSRRLLKGNDVSYGVYIYHMLIINSFLYFGFQKDVMHLVVALILSGVAGYLSWISIERRFLKRKAR
ncbi:MAG: acyltransferase family protein [Flavobacteriales bacterium]